MLPSRNKYWALFFLVCATSLLLILAPSLPRLQFAPGKISAAPTPAANNILPNNVGTAESLMMIFRGMLALAVVVLPFYILISFFTKEGRKRLLGLLVNGVMMLILLMMLNGLVNRPPSDQPTPTPEAEIAPAPPGELPFMAGGTPEVFEATKSPGMDMGICLGISILFAAVVALLVWRMTQRRPPSTTLERLANEAQSALDAIQAGLNANDAIIRCYGQMCQAVYEERAVQRYEAMTTQEFIQVLSKMGLPEAPVRRLTRLFEDVRYGSRQSTPIEQQDAILCLTSIIAACKKPK
jgi:hypothetical protein